MKINHVSRLINHSLFAFFLVGVFGASVQAQVYEKLVQFPKTGTNPKGILLRAPDGSFFGTTPYGGAEASGSYGGTVFHAIPPANSGDAWKLMTVMNVTFPTNNGAYPCRTGDELIMDSAGHLYGTTVGGYGYGTIFEMIPPTSAGGAWRLRDLAVFNVLGKDGPSGSLLLDSNDAIYGVTRTDGGSIMGTIFRLSPPTNSGDRTLTTLHRFDAASEICHTMVW